MGQFPKYLIQKISQRIKQQLLEKARELSLKNDIFFKKKKKLLIYFLLNSLCTLTKEENQLSGEAELCESEDSPHLAAASHLPVTIPLPSALTCPHQRPRCHVCSLPKAPDEIFFFWAPHFSLLNQVQGDKCHRDW